MDFWFFWDIFRKRWNIILLVTCIGALAAGVYSKLFITPVYRSSVSLYLGRVTESSPLEKAVALSGGDGLGATASQLALGAQLTGDYRELINFEVITEGVSDELAKTGKWEKKPYNVTAEQTKTSRIMKINIDSESDEWVSLGKYDVFNCIKVVQYDKQELLSIFSFKGLNFESAVF